MPNRNINSTSANVPHSGLNKVFTVDQTIDFSVNPVAAGDTVTINLAANTVVQDIYSQVVAASTDASTRTLDIGDGGSATCWASNVDMKTTGNLTRGTATSLPEIYVTADKILVTFDHALTTGKLRIVAICAKL